jgi:hypothetical protein
MGRGADGGGFVATVKVDFRGPSHRCDEGRRRHERFDRRGHELKAGRSEKSSGHVSNSVGYGIKKL